MKHEITPEIEAKLRKYRISVDEFKDIEKRLDRPMKDIEWSLFSAMWSEHCSYKSSKIHLKKLYSRGSRVMQSFGENAGVIDLGHGERIAFKMESHNHPSFIEPYQGAATGVGGILRDIFTMGARPIMLANYLCFGTPRAPRMKALVDGVVRGIAGYGNCVGVATVTGQTEFHESYDQNILVNALAVGLFREGEKIHLSQAAGVGNFVVYVGAKTGRDGVMGASMASDSFDAQSNSNRPTVQIGDPFFEKLLIESCLEVMKEDLVVAIQDMGAAGLTSSSFEMASKGGVGFDINLDLVPLRDQSMSAEDILLSESQERMLLICEPAKLGRIQEIFSRWGLDACKIGMVTSSTNVRLSYHGELLTEIDPKYLVDDVPLYQRPFEKWQPIHQKESGVEVLHSLHAVTDARQTLLTILGSEHGCSRDWVYRHYDQRVGAQTIADCSENFGIVRLADSKRALALVLGCRPSVMRLDARLGGIDSIAYPALQLAAKSFESLAVTDCLNYGNPQRVKVMSEFVASVSSMSQMCEQLEAPIISGNVSFYNETGEQNITSTPATGIVGLRQDMFHIPKSHFCAAGEKIFVLNYDGPISGGLLAQNSSVPLGFSGDLDPKMLKDFIKLTFDLAALRSVSATRVVGKFGLAYALARMSLKGVGAKIATQNILECFSVTDISFVHKILFAEKMYQVIFVTKDPAHFKQEFSNHNSIFRLFEIGETAPEFLEIDNVLKLSASELESKYQFGLGGIFGF
jgi:phosphoribosylformylglycinamidine synthase II